MAAGIDEKAKFATRGRKCTYLFRYLFRIYLRVHILFLLARFPFLRPVRLSLPTRHDDEEVLSSKTVIRYRF